MTTLNNVELLIITIVLSLYFIASLVLVIQLIKFMTKVKVLGEKAESVIENVETASKAFVTASKATGPFKVVSFLQSLMNSSKEGEK